MGAYYIIIIIFFFLEISIGTENFDQSLRFRYWNYLILLLFLKDLKRILFLKWEIFCSFNLNLLILISRRYWRLILENLCFHFFNFEIFLIQFSLHLSFLIVYHIYLKPQSIYFFFHQLTFLILRPNLISIIYYLNWFGSFF